MWGQMVHVNSSHQSELKMQLYSRVLSLPVYPLSYDNSFSKTRVTEGKLYVYIDFEFQSQKVFCVTPSTGAYTCTRKMRCSVMCTLRDWQRIQTWVGGCRLDGRGGQSSTERKRRRGGAERGGKTGGRHLFVRANASGGLSHTANTCIHLYLYILLQNSAFVCLENKNASGKLCIRLAPVILHQHTASAEGTSWANIAVGNVAGAQYTYPSASVFFFRRFVFSYFIFSLCFSSSLRLRKKFLLFFHNILAIDQTDSQYSSPGVPGVLRARATLTIRNIHPSLFSCSLSSHTLPQLTFMVQRYSYSRLTLCLLALFLFSFFPCITLFIDKCLFFASKISFLHSLSPPFSSLLPPLFVIFFCSLFFSQLSLLNSALQLPHHLLPQESTIPSVLFILTHLHYLHWYSTYLSYRITQKPTPGFLVPLGPPHPAPPNSLSLPNNLFKKRTF